MAIKKHVLLQKLSERRIGNGFESAYVIVNKPLLESSLELHNSNPSKANKRLALRSIVYFGQCSEQPPEARWYGHDKRDKAKDNQLRMIVVRQVKRGAPQPGEYAIDQLSIFWEFIVERLSSAFNSDCQNLAGVGNATSFIHVHMAKEAANGAHDQQMLDDILRALFARRYVTPKKGSKHEQQTCRNLPELQGSRLKVDDLPTVS